jgi:hypothetical protein
MPQTLFDLPAPVAPGAPVTGGRQNGKLFDATALTRAQTADASPDLAPLLAPFKGLQDLAGAIGATGEAAGQIASHLADARDLAQVTSADTALRNAYSDFETWRAAEGAADETRWPTEWDNRAKATLSRFYEENNLSPRARRETDLRASKFISSASIRTARDGAQRTFARGRAGVQSAIENALLDRNPGGVREAYNAGVQSGLYFPDEAELGIRKANTEIETLQRQDRLESLQAQAITDPDSVLGFTTDALSATALEGVQVTSYGYADDPYLDTNSANGIGHRNNQLHAGLSVALAKKTAQELGAEPGDDLLVTLPDGTTRQAKYDDTIPPDYDEHRIDIYSPDGPVPFDGQAAKVQVVPGGVSPQDLSRLQSTARAAIRQRHSDQYDQALDRIASGQTSEDAIRTGAGPDLRPHDIQSLLNYAASIDNTKPTDPAIYADLLNRVESYDPSLDPGGAVYLAIKGAIAASVRSDDMGELTSRLYRRRIDTADDTPKPRKELTDLISKTVEAAFKAGAFHPGGTPPESGDTVDLGAEATAQIGRAAALMAANDYLARNPDADETKISTKTLEAIRAPALGLSADLFNTTPADDPTDLLSAIAAGRDTAPAKQDTPLSFLTWKQAEQQLRAKYPDGKVPLHEYRLHQRTWAALTGADPKTTGPALDRHLQETAYEDIPALLEKLTGSQHPSLLRRWQDRHDALNGR